MITWKDFSNLRLFKELRLKSTATIVVESATTAGAIRTITAAELVRAADTSTRRVNLTAATLTVTELHHDGRTITINSAAGTTITLPAATGSGSRFRFILGTTITSVGAIIKVADSTDVMVGTAWLSSDNAADAVISFEAGATADTITLNGTTSGGIAGDIVELEDIATDQWSVRVMAQATGTEVTPFSATV